MAATRAVVDGAWAGARGAGRVAGVGGASCRRDAKASITQWQQATKSQFVPGAADAKVVTPDPAFLC